MATRERSTAPNRSVNTADSRRFGRYDLVLVLIPAAFVVSLLAGHLLSLPAHLSVAAASLASAAVVLDGMFRNPPVSGGE